MGHRALMHLLGAGLDMFFDTDAREPSFRRAHWSDRKFFGDNADCIYYVAPVDPAFEYRIRGNISGAAYTSFAVDGGGIDERYPPARIVSSIHDGQFDVAADGSFEIVASVAEAATQLAPARARRGVDLDPPLLRAGRTGRGRPARAHPPGHPGHRRRADAPDARGRRSPATSAASTRSSRAHDRHRPSTRSPATRGRATAQPVQPADGVEAGRLRRGRHREHDDEVRARTRRGIGHRGAVPAVPVGGHRALEPLPADARLPAPPRLAQPRAARARTGRLVPCGRGGAGSRAHPTGSRPRGRTPARSSCG